jgi:TolB protein
MPSIRVEVLIAAGAGALVAVAAVGVLVLRDDAPEAHGELIAYSCREPGSNAYAVCVMNADGSERRRLTHGLETADPTWSADGRRIAFTRNEAVGEYTRFANDDVFVMDADGSDAHQLTAEQEGRRAGQPAWSPDGRELAFVRASPAGTLQLGELFVVRSDGSDARRLLVGLNADPAWSPDGRTIAFAKCRCTRDPPSYDMGIWIVDAPGGTPHALTAGKGFVDSAPAWSPDGRQIAFARATERTLYDGGMEIWVMNRDGTGQRRLLEHRHYATSPFSMSWSPDGDMLAFETSPAVGCTGISVVEVRTAVLRPLTSCTRSADSTLAPAWQPDARGGGS